MDGVGDLIGFLDRIGRNRFECLDAIPLATMLAVAKPIQDRGKSVEAHFAIPHERGPGCPSFSFDL
jgi:hypothetical protein